MMKTTEYVIYRHGSNGANQPMTQTMPIGIYDGAGKTAAERRADAIEKAASEQTIYNNQWLDAIPSARVGAEEKDNAWEHQLSAQPTEAFHPIGHVS